MEAVLLRFLRTTIIGGILFLLPFGVLAMLVTKIVTATRDAIEPIASDLPFETVVGLRASVLIAVLAIVVVSFIAGVVARAAAAQVLVRMLETYVLAHLPGYGMLKALSQDVAADAEHVKHPVVFLNQDGVRQIAIKTGETPDGASTILYVPDSPTPQSGAVLVVDSSCVEVTTIPLRKAFAALADRGVSLAALLAQAPASAGSER